MYIKFDKVIELSEWLEKPKIDYGKRHIESRCPFCGDSRTKKNVKRFHVDFYSPYNTFIYKCHRCGESGNIVSLYSFLKGCSYSDAKKILLNKKYDPNKIKKFLRKKSYSKTEPIEVDADLDIDINNECYTVDSRPDNQYDKRNIEKLKKFKEDRKIPDSLPIYFAHSGRYKSRIIIPIYVNNKLVYFQGRSIYKEIEPKYLNPKVEKNKIILNSDKFERDKYIIINEGIIDAYSIDNNQGTCVIGGYIDKDYINKIMKYTDKGVIICLDNPKKDQNSRKVLKKLITENINKYRFGLKFFIMPDKYEAKDLNDLLVYYDIKNMYNFVVENSVSILHMKTYLI